MTFRQTINGNMTGTSSSDSIDVSELEMTSLVGSPDAVKGDFDCSNNHLKTLKFSPTKVDGDFDCSDNWLISVEFAPAHIGKWFLCKHNPYLYSLWPLKFTNVKTNRILCDDRLKYQKDLVKICETEEEFATDAYRGTTNTAIREYFIANYEHIAALEAIDEIF